MPETNRDNMRAERKRFFEKEIERLADRLYGTALRLTRHPDDAEDIVAETVGRAWSRLDELQNPGRFEGWLFRILNNIFISNWRKRQSRQALETELDLSDTESSDALEFSLFKQLHQPFLLWWGTPEQRVIEQLMREDIQQALDKLPDEFRITLVMVEVQGYSYRETSEMLEIPQGTVRSRLSRARAMLQKTLWECAREAGIVQSPATPREDAIRGEP